MKKVISIVCTAALCVLLLSGCGCDHNWKAATCQEAQVCSLCQKVGKPALGHNWQDATCEAPKTCTNCAQTEGEPLGHIGVFEGAAINCSVCQKNLTEETETLVQEELFLFTPTEFMDRLVAIAQQHGETLTYAFSNETGFFHAEIQRGDETALIQFFHLGSQIMTEADKDTSRVWCVYLADLNATDKYLRCYFMMTCDPTMDRGEAYALDMSLSTAFRRSIAAGGFFGFTTSNNLLYEYSLSPSSTEDNLVHMLGIYASDYRNESLAVPPMA